MKLVLAAAAALLATTPALATGGFECKPISGRGPSLVLTVGHTVSPAVVSATLKEGRTTLSTQGRQPALTVGQSWIDSRYLWLDLTDGNVTRHEAKLRTTFQPRVRGRPAVGTLFRGGRSYAVRCLEA